MRWLTRRTAPGAIAVLLFGGLAIKALADNPHAARVKEELSREVRGIPPPPEAALDGCEEISGWGKGAYVACSYTGSVETRSLQRHYDEAFLRRGWQSCGDGASNNGGMAWHLYCKADRRAELSRQAGERTTNFGLTLTWPR
jgi:hypothetical protein